MYKRKIAEQETEIKYIVLSNDVSIDGVTAPSYGIGAIRNDSLIAGVLDVSTDKEKITNLVTLCNEEHLELCHLHAVAEDATI